MRTLSINKKRYQKNSISLSLAFLEKKQELKKARKENIIDEPHTLFPMLSFPTHLSLKKGYKDRL